MINLKIMIIDNDFKLYKKNIYVHKTAEIGKKVKIQPFVTIGKNVEVGDYTEISSFVAIGGHAEMPKRKKSIYSVIIGKNVNIREYVSIHSGFNDNTIIEDDVYIMSHSHIAHDCYIKSNATIAIGVTLSGSVQIGEESFIGIESSLHQGTIVGDLTILGANSFGKGELKSCLKYVGNPAVPIGINKVGISRSAKKKKDIEGMLKKAKTGLNFNE